MQNNSGFSLVELMVVLAIVGLLSSLAYPVYVNYWVQVKRLEGRFALLALSARLEEYAIGANGYLNSNFETLDFEEHTEHKWYKLKIEQLNAGYYKLSAIPTFNDSTCKSLSCDSNNQYTYEGTGSYNECWGGY